MFGFSRILWDTESAYGFYGRVTLPNFEFAIDSDLVREHFRTIREHNILSNFGKFAVARSNQHTMIPPKAWGYIEPNASHIKQIPIDVVHT